MQGQTLGTTIQLIAQRIADHDRNYTGGRSEHAPFGTWRSGGDDGMTEAEKNYIIMQLEVVHRGRSGELLASMDYRSLVSLLAVQEAVNS
ncbi:hypothetical protein H7992_06990 [Sporosarcina sp. resist]|uniref:hypothetical protein n=1 Tax=Sporosarcina sp. resist TaxID=2762563 RepID=UPI00164D752B|nr:hypothetical protein [Sporosarcina sp. resist]QNK89405.1 hypothetical protein H7992_06990 [Sporosarcina sp. resist]